MSHYDDEEGRRTYSTPLGDLRSVTSYLSELAKPALVPWAAGVTAEYFKDHLGLIKSGELNIEKMDVETLVKEAKAHHKLLKEQASDLGVAVHDAIEDFYSFGTNPSDPQVQNLRNEAIAVMNEKLNMVINETEKMVYHKAGFAGTLDIVGLAAPGLVRLKAPAILDIKTGKQIYDEAKMQIAAYAAAWEQMNKEKVKYAIILRLDKETGKAAAPFVMKRSQWLRHYKAFAKLVKFCQEKDKLKPKKEKKNE